MKRATITLSDELEAELEDYLAGQEVPPSFTSLVQAALRSFLAAPRAGRRSRAAGGAPASEVAEEIAVYGGEARTGGGGGPWAWGAPAAPRLREVPGLLASVPRLSELEARELADDLGRAREELERGELHDPWSPPPGAARGGVSGSEGR